MENIDILVATYNGAQYIAAQLESLLTQTYPNLNILISDDHSSDNTWEILQEFAQKDNRIQLFSQEENRGFIQNFAFLLRQSTADYFALCDQDDVWYPEKIEKSYHFLKESGADLVFSDLEVVDEALNPLAPSFMRLKNLLPKVEIFDKENALILDNVATGCTILAKKEILEGLFPFPNQKTIPHDYWLALNVALKGKLCYLDEPLLKYRQHDANQIGTNTKTGQMKTFIEIRRHLIYTKWEKSLFFCLKKGFLDEKEKEPSKEIVNYFSKLSEHYWLYLRQFHMFKKVYQKEPTKRLLQLFFLLHMPILGRLFFLFTKKQNR